MDSKNRVFDACTIYLLLWALGYVQKMFISSSSISMLFYVPYLAMTLYYAVKMFSNYRTNFSGWIIVIKVDSLFYCL